MNLGKYIKLQTYYRIAIKGDFMEFLRISLAGIFFLASLHLLSSLACGQDWRTIYNSETHRYYYDKASVSQPAKNIVRVTQKVVEKGEDRSEVVKFIYVYEIDCRRDKYRVLSKTEFDTVTGKETKTDTPDTKMDNSVYLDSKVLAVAENVCR